MRSAVEVPMFECSPPTKDIPLPSAPCPNHLSPLEDGMLSCAFCLCMTWQLCLETSVGKCLLHSVPTLLLSLLLLLLESFSKNPQDFTNSPSFLTFTSKARARSYPVLPKKKKKKCLSLTRNLKLDNRKLVLLPCSVTASDIFLLFSLSLCLGFYVCFFLLLKFISLNARRE